MKRRLKAYREANNSEIAEPALVDFFSKSIQVYREKLEADSYVAIGGMKVYVERVRYSMLIIFSFIV